MRWAWTLAAALLLGRPAAVPAQECRPEELPQDARELLRPIVEARTRQPDDRPTDRRSTAEKPGARELRGALQKVLDDRSPAGDQALAWLLTIDLANGAEEVVCEVVNRGSHMAELVRAFRDCPPQTGLEPLPEKLRGSPLYAKTALEGLERGKPCVYEDTGEE
jgi:hypothetical protein